MALDGPKLRHSRVDSGDAEDVLDRALRLSREVEELLESRSSPALPDGSPDSSRAHSIRIARAMAASLVDELEGIARARRLSDRSPPSERVSAAS